MVFPVLPITAFVKPVHIICAAYESPKAFQTSRTCFKHQVCTSTDGHCHVIVFTQVLTRPNSISTWFHQPAKLLSGLAFRNMGQLLQHWYVTLDLACQMGSQLLHPQCLPVWEARQHSMRLRQVLLRLLAPVEDRAVAAGAQHILQIACRHQREALAFQCVKNYLAQLP